MKGAIRVFAQLFKGILCLANSTPMFCCVWKGRVLWAHFCAPSSQITRHKSSGRSTLKLCFGSVKIWTLAQKLTPVFEAAVRSAIKIKGVSTLAVIVLTRN